MSHSQADGVMTRAILTNLSFIGQHKRYRSRYPGTAEEAMVAGIKFMSLWCNHYGDQWAWTYRGESIRLSGYEARDAAAND